MKRMKHKKLTVTVGIPAYNEEANIAKLLKRVLAQHELGFLLKRVIVVSDASTDSTDAIVSRFQDRKTELLRNTKRKGQSYCQNLIFSQSSSDIVVILEADTLPSSKNYLNDL